MASRPLIDSAAKCKLPLRKGSRGPGRPGPALRRVLPARRRSWADRQLARETALPLPQCGLQPAGRGPQDGLQVDTLDSLPWGTRQSPGPAAPSMGTRQLHPGPSHPACGGCFLPAWPRVRATHCRVWEGARPCCAESLPALRAGQGENTCVSPTPRVYSDSCPSRR